VQLRFPFRRALGVLAVGAVGATTAVLGAPGVAQAAGEITGTANSDADPTWTVPEGSCLVEWVITGARGGDGNAPAEAPDERTVRTMVSGGDVFTLVPGSAGAAAPSGLGGSSSAGSGGYGGADGAGATDGGGGAASVVMDGEYVYLWADGGVGGGPGGGAGGTGTDEAGTGNFDLDSTDSTVPTELAGPDGFISATAFACDAVEEEPVLAAPHAPADLTVTAGDTELNVRWREDYADGVAQADSWEYRLAGDPFWRPVNVGPVDGEFSLGLAGLENGQAYTIQVRGSSDTAGPGAEATVTGTPYKAIGAPATVEPGTGPAEVTITWGAPSEAGTYELAGWKAVLLLNYEERGGPVYTCEAEPDVRSCTVPAMPGDLDYRVVVFAVDSEGNDGRESDIVPVGPVPAPAGVPASDGSLQAPTATTGGVVAGEQVTFSGTGYAPFSVVTLLVYSEPQVLGTVLTDAAGAFTATVTLPEGLAAGSHTLVAAGLDPSGEMRYLTLPITVVTATGATTGRLALTGVDVQAPLAGGLAALGIGTALIVVSRRRRAGA
jgi:hypothetical protein